jgi:hypothetical protein
MTPRRPGPGDRAGDVDGVVRQHSAAREADVHVDQRGDRKVRQKRGARGRVDRHRQPRALAERAEPFDLRRVQDLVGDQQVVEAVPRQDLRLADRRTGEAGAAGRRLEAGDGGRLVRLHVRTERTRAAAEERRHGVDVPGEGVDVDTERRRR